jgi:hypothetical protein
MKKPLILFVAFMVIFSCKNKKQEEDTNFFPALSFIKSQVAHVDTSLYSIIKIVKTDSTADTTFIKREQFKEAAKDFLSLPDITSGKLKDDYEETKLYDNDLQQAVLNYMPKDQGAEIQRQEVMIQPNPNGDQVKSIFINLIKNDGDSTVQKVLFWQVDKRFKVVTTVHKANMPEKTQTLEVVWNDAPSAK